MPLPKSPIRQLAWDYYLGKVTPRDEYLRRRRLLVEAAINGGPVPVFETTVPETMDLDLDSDPTSTALNPQPESSPTQPLPTPPSPEPVGKNRLALLGIRAVVAIIAIGVFIFAADPQPNTELAQSQTESVARVEPTSAIPEELLQAITELETAGWSDTAARNLVAKWTAATPAVQSQLKELPAISAITETTARRTSELMTMASAGVEIGTDERDALDKLLGLLGLAPVVWPSAENSDADTTAQPTTVVSIVQPIAEPVEPGLPSTITATITAEFADDNQPPISQVVAAISPPDSPEPDQNSTIEPAPVPQIIPAPQNIKKTTETAKPVGTATAISKPAVKKPSRPAAIVLSERSGCTASLVKNRKSICRDYLSSKVRAPRMAVIPAGNFTMGDSRRPTESPEVEVTITGVLAISTHEISSREFQLYCKNSGATCPANPGSDKNLPVVNVTWQEATDYAAWLSKRTGKHYRLPSEAEWEYAARAGTQTAYPFGDNLMVTQARYSSRKRQATEPLTNTYQAINPNGFQLYHMVGNVREWVADSWQDHHDSTIAAGAARTNGSQRVVRGGSFADNAEQLRSSARQPLDATNRDQFTGFRVVLDFSAAAS